MGLVRRAAVAGSFTPARAMNWANHRQSAHGLPTGSAPCRPTAQSCPRRLCLFRRGGGFGLCAVATAACGNQPACCSARCTGADQRAALPEGEASRHATGNSATGLGLCKTGGTSASGQRQPIGARAGAFAGSAQLPFAARAGSFHAGAAGGGRRQRRTGGSEVLEPGALSETLIGNQPRFIALPALPAGAAWIRITTH